MNVRIVERERDRQIETDWFYLLLFSQVATIVMAVSIGSLDLCWIQVSCAWQGPNHSGHLHLISQVCWQTSRLEVKPGLDQPDIWMSVLPAAALFASCKVSPGLLLPQYFCSIKMHLVYLYRVK